MATFVKQVKRGNNWVEVPVEIDKDTNNRLCRLFIASVMQGLSSQAKDDAEALVGLIGKNERLKMTVDSGQQLTALVVGLCKYFNVPEKNVPTDMTFKHEVNSPAVSSSKVKAALIQHNEKDKGASTKKAEEFIWEYIKADDLENLNIINMASKIAKLDSLEKLGLTKEEVMTERKVTVKSEVNFTNGSKGDN